MGWGADFQSPEERDAEQRAMAEAQTRARMTPFERQLLDVLGEIRDLLRPMYVLDAAREAADTLAAVLGVPSADAAASGLVDAAGVGDVDSGGPPDSPRPGPPRPDSPDH